MHENTVLLTDEERALLQPGDDLVPIWGRQNLIEGVVALLWGYSQGPTQEVEIVIAEHYGRPPPERLDEADDRE